MSIVNDNMSDPLEHLMNYATPPKDGEIVVVWKDENTKDIVQIKDGLARLWRYGIKDDVFCSVGDIIKWRGCTGFNF